MPYYDRFWSNCDPDDLVVVDAGLVMFDGDRTRNGAPTLLRGVRIGAPSTNGLEGDVGIYGTGPYTAERYLASKKCKDMGILDIWYDRKRPNRYAGWTGHLGGSMSPSSWMDCCDREYWKPSQDGDQECTQIDN
jgi:hypothetical protein